jgi:hypothetical protein
MRVDSIVVLISDPKNYFAKNEIRIIVPKKFLNVATRTSTHGAYAIITCLTGKKNPYRYFNPMLTKMYCVGLYNYYTLTHYPRINYNYQRRTMTEADRERRELISALLLHNLFFQNEFH